LNSGAGSAAELDSMPQFQTAAVIGAGLMGRRLAGTLAAGGLTVRLFDIQASILDIATTEANATATRMAAARGGTAGIVTAVSELRQAASGADFVTEAVIEDLEVKRSLFHELADYAPNAILASNSSVLPITQIAAWVDDASRVVGTHWWNPPDLIPIVEVIQGERTSPDVVDDVINLLQALGKQPVRVRQDVPGFIGNRLQHALWREAIALVEDGVADAQTVDLVARNTIGLRLAQMGPIENADYIGLDLTKAIHAAVFPSLNRSVTPSRLLDELIDEESLGAKSGKGLLTWPPGSREAAGEALAAHILAGLPDSGASRGPGQ
jgi:3-hydroxybutyryl-CoA dehydrogenase